MNRSKGFTLIEVIAVISLLALLSVVLIVNITSISNNNNKKIWEKVVDRVESAAISYIDEKYENYILESSNDIIPVSELIKAGLLDEKNVIDPFDDTNVTLKKDLSYHYARVYLNENETVEVEYPLLKNNYISINPKIVITEVGIVNNLIDNSEIKICNKNNACETSNNSKIKLTLANTNNSISSSYAFSEAKDTYVKYAYDTSEGTIIAYRFYKVREKNCTLLINNGATFSNSKQVSLKLSGTNISKYSISEKDSDGELKKYTSSNLPDYTFSSTGNKTLYAQCYYETTIPYSNKSVATIKIGYEGQKNWEYANSGTLTIPTDANYKIELWGASGSSGLYCQGQNYNCSYDAGKSGGYTAGIVSLKKDEKLSIYVNTGGGSGSYWNSWAYGGSGGGSTDVRFSGTTVYDRIMVAAGGGSGFGGAAGGLTGYSSNNSPSGVGGTQTSGYAFGTGSSGVGYSSGGAGGGYYGGTAYLQWTSGGGGGSSFISGHNGCNAIDSNHNHTGSSIHFSGKAFTNTVMIDGNGYSWTNVKGSLMQMPNPTGGYFASGKGYTGTGYARITYVDE